MKVFSEELVEEARVASRVADLSQATIGEVLLVAQYLERKTGIPFIRMDQGSPGLPANRYGVEAEKAALDRGVGSQYPPADGVPELKKAAARFIKAFIDVDIDPGKDKVLFIDPGFPIQKSQLRVLGIRWKEFDIYPYRGEGLRAKLEEELAAGDVAAIVYSNPNNPAWICLEESELQVIGELATKYDAIVMEDLAYFCMDYRRELGKPFEPPYVPTVAHYTDNYILMLSSSKIFSYAGQRMALIGIGDNLFTRAALSRPGGALPRRRHLRPDAHRLHPLHDHQRLHRLHAVRLCAHAGALLRRRDRFRGGYPRVRAPRGPDEGHLLPERLPRGL